MVEPMDVVDELHCRNWAELQLQGDRPVTFVELAHRRNIFLQTGEFVCLRDPIPFTIQLLNGSFLSYNATVGRILHVENDPKEGSLVQLNLLAGKSQFPHFPDNNATPPPPADRTYLLFPTELVWTNSVMLISPNCLQLEAFVFCPEFILEGAGGLSFGMANAYYVRYRLGCEDAHWSPLPPFLNSGFQAFPHYDCYSKRAWDNLLSLSRLISTELSRSSIGQSTRQTKIIDYSRSQWAYLSQRLGSPFEKEGVSTTLFPRKNGTKEITKVRLTKLTHRIDTASKFALLQSILGQPGITTGLRMPNPRAPKMKARDQFGFAAQRASIGDTFNLFLPLTEQSVDGTTHRPKHRGIDLHFDESKMKMKVSLRFRRAMPGDGHIRQLFGLSPLDSDGSDDIGGSSSSSSLSDVEEEEVEVAPPPVLLKRTDLLGNDNYLLRVRRVLNLRTHVVVSVQESSDADIVVGSERMLTMDEAVLLYREYHNVY